MINGPRDQPELEEFFETEQKLDAASLSQEFDIDYYPTNDSDSLAQNLSKWLESKNCSLLEIKSDSKNNQQIFELFKKHIQN
jgi:2-succinyl-5-enolpyruvyl-6-hydroxy-3-cyclohexene-1-carboxylate synthase